MSESKPLPSTRTAKDLARKEPKKTIPIKTVEKVVKAIKAKTTADIKKLDKILKDTQTKMVKHIKSSKTSSTKVPFVFARMKDNAGIFDKDNVKCWVVIISEPVYEMIPPVPGEPRNCLHIPENTLEDKKAEKTFSSSKKAYAYVKEWWTKPEHSK